MSPMQHAGGASYECLYKYLPFGVTATLVLVISLAVHQHEHYSDWFVSRLLLAGLLWAYCQLRQLAFTAHATMDSEHAQACLVWVASTTYNLVLDRSGDNGSDIWALVTSTLSAACVFSTLYIERHRSSKKDGLSHQHYLHLQLARAVWVGLLFCSHRQTPIRDMGSAKFIVVQMLYFGSFLFSPIDSIKKAPLHLDCKLIQRVWILTDDWRMVCLLTPLFVHQLNKISFVQTGDGWDASAHEQPAVVPGTAEQQQSRDDVEAQLVVNTNRSTCNETRRKPAQLTPSAALKQQEQRRQLLQEQVRSLTRQKRTEKAATNLFTKQENSKEVLNMLMQKVQPSHI